MSSMDFTSFSDASETCNGIVDGMSIDVDAYAILILIRGIASSGIMSICALCSFSFINLSIYVFISLICAFCSMIRFNISSLWPSVSTISLACEYYMAGSFNYFLRDAISTF
jgi:hypothetical protein